MHCIHYDVNKWKHFSRYWPFVREIYCSPVNSPHKGQWRGALMFSLICAWINAWVNKREAGDSRRHRTHYDVIVMLICSYYAHHVCMQWCITAWTYTRYAMHHSMSATIAQIGPLSFQAAIEHNQYWSYKPHSNFKPTWNFLKILYVSFKWYFWQK